MLNIKENIELKDFTTLGVGGPARYFVEVKTIPDVEEALKFAGEKHLDTFVLSGGSNIFVSADGFVGLVNFYKI